jgi:hypothetical protein
MSDGRERRRRARVEVAGEVQGRIHTAQSAPVIDLSETGALLEVPCSLKPLTVYILRLPVGEEELGLKARVVRCSVHGFGKAPNGESVMRYRAAVEFIDMSDKERQALSAQVIARSGMEVLNVDDDLPDDFDTDFDAGDKG